MRDAVGKQAGADRLASLHSAMSGAIFLRSSCPRGQKRPACPDSLRRQFRNQFATWRPTHPAAIAAVPDRTCRWATGRRSGPPLGRRSWTRIVGSSPAQSKNPQNIGWPRPVLRNPKLGEGSRPCRAARSEGAEQAVLCKASGSGHEQGKATEGASCTQASPDSRADRGPSHARQPARSMHALSITCLYLCVQNTPGQSTDLHARGRGVGCRNCRCRLLLCSGTVVGGAQSHTVLSTSHDHGPSSLARLRFRGGAVFKFGLAFPSGGRGTQGWSTTTTTTTSYRQSQACPPPDQHSDSQCVCVGLPIANKYYVIVCI